MKRINFQILFLQLANVVISGVYTALCVFSFLIDSKKLVVFVLALTVLFAAEQIVFWAYLTSYTSVYVLPDNQIVFCGCLRTYKAKASDCESVSERYSAYEFSFKSGKSLILRKQLSLKEFGYLPLDSKTKKMLPASIFINADKK